MDVLSWIRQTLQPTACDSEALIYEDMESQSGRCLPIIYQPFDAGRRAHWRDRGACWDFLLAARGQGRRVLDFGPGDGWPSLIIAPYVDEVVGVEGARRRAAVCRENAARLGLDNARFVHVAPGSPLPFEDGSFDAVTAASSLEQSVDPRATLAELLRVLRPGGRLRFHYEALGRYRGGRERDLWLWAIDGGHCRLLLYDRDLEGERAVQVGLDFALSAPALREALAGGPGELSFADVTAAGLERLRPALRDARVCTTIHPSGPTWLRWLRELGFGQALPSHSGIALAGALFEALPEEGRPADLAAVDGYLRPIVGCVVELPAPADADPPITAVK